MRRLDIGVVVYGNARALSNCVTAIKQHSVTDWRLFLIVNPHPTDGEANALAADLASKDPRIVHVPMPENVGYAGGVNKLFELFETEYVAYLDHDAKPNTRAWDEMLCSYLDRFHELGIIFPNGGHMPIDRGTYQEILWAAGFAWVMPRLAQRAVGLLDTEIGHHEEVDLQTRLRLAGYRIGCAPEVSVSHEEIATRSPESQERINRGVVAWMNKWLRHFAGANVNYHSPNVLRVLDWNCNALHCEEYYRLKLPGLNAEPEVVKIDGAEYDLIKVPRPKGFYRNRIV